MPIPSPIPEPTPCAAKLGTCENCGRLNKIVKGNCGPCRGVMGYFFQAAWMTHVKQTRTPKR